MQIGDDEQALVIPEQCTREIGGKRYARNVQSVVSRNRDRPLFRQLIFARCLRHRFPNELLGGFGQELVGSLAINRLAADFQHDGDR